MSTINERFLISPFFVLFLIYTNLVGVGIINFQRDIIEGAGYDAWISVILCGLSIHIIVWMMYRILDKANQDVIDINPYCGFIRYLAIPFGRHYYICFLFRRLPPAYHLANINFAENC
ncbi:spore germination protein [Paenibacillus sp. tmac-D7]|uniref:spore germination protein n=1 Tax=Paenibacillus sp. tmac-D7 TaxID=2591462 RepID=UPI00215AE944|nr:spore germination protein [Paenibacillus sp. tmac-D7]